MANNQQDNNLQNSSEIKNQNTDVNTDVYIQGNASGGNVAGRDIHITHIHNALQDSHLKIDTQYVTSTHKMAKETIERINNYFYGYFKLFQILTEFPVLKDTGIYQSELNIQDSIKNHINQLTINDPHALLNHPTNYFDSPITFHYKTTDFATICALREIQEKPQIISAGVVAINEEKRTLFLHRRTPKSATYANALHIIGGGYAPLSTDERVKDDGYSLKNTMTREFSEEFRIQVNIPKNIKILFGKESDTGFIQIVALGATVDSDDIDKIHTNWEGDKVLLEFDDLYDKLTDKNEFWVPSGKAHILIWLALGAPSCHPNTKFSGYSAKELFDKIIGQLELSL